MPRIDIIDLSHWNEVSDFRELTKAGVTGVIHKATEGTSYVDPTYRDRMDPALNAGLWWGAYHFLKHGNVIDQMEHFASNTGLPEGARVAVDYEDPACTLDDLREALEWLDENTDFQVCVYAGGLLKGQVGSNPYPWLSPYPLWLAQYGPTPEWPTQIWKHWSLWQFTDQGKVKGIEGACDLNTFNGTPENCALWMGPLNLVPGPEPVKSAVIIDIQTPPGVDVIVSVNGEPL